MALQGTSNKDEDDGGYGDQAFPGRAKANLGVSKRDLVKAQKRYKKRVNKNRRQVSFKVGQKVWLNVKNFTLSHGLTPKFMAKFAGPFLVVKRVFDDAYKLALPPEIKMNPVFHVATLSLVRR